MGWREKQTKAFPLFRLLSLEMLYRRVEIEKQEEILSMSLTEFWISP